MKLLPSFGKHQPDIEELSAYLDGEVAAARAQQVESHIAGCEPCRGTLDELRSARLFLAAMPEEPAPRSFRLRQAQVDALAKPAGAGFGAASLMRWAPALSGAAAFVFIVVAGADLFTQTDSSNDMAATRSESTGSIAADSGLTESAISKTGDDAAAGAALDPAITPPDVGTFVPASDVDPDDTSSGDIENQAPAPGALESTRGEPTGAPPSGDGPIPSAGTEGEQGADGAAGSAPSGDFLPPPTALNGEVATQADGDTLVEREIPAGTSTPAEVQAFSDDGSSDSGNRTGFRVVQITAAAVAALAGAAFIASRWRRRGA